MLCFQIIEHYHFEAQMTWIFLGVIVLVMFFEIVASVWANRKNEK